MPMGNWNATTLDGNSSNLPRKGGRIDAAGDWPPSAAGWGVAFVIHSGLPLRAFLVEDNEVIRANLEDALAELAHVEVVAFSGSALEASDWLAVHSGEWDLAVVDLFLTEGSGLTVLASCRVRDPGQRVAVLSNYATRDMRSRCKAFGADAVFDKSTELDEFIEFCLDRTM